MSQPQLDAIAAAARDVAYWEAFVAKKKQFDPATQATHTRNCQVARAALKAAQKASVAQGCTTSMQAEAVRKGRQLGVKDAVQALKSAA